MKGEKIGRNYGPFVVMRFDIFRLICFLIKSTDWCFYLAWFYRIIMVTINMHMFTNKVRKSHQALDFLSKLRQ